VKEGISTRKRGKARRLRVLAGPDCLSHPPEQSSVWTIHGGAKTDQNFTDTDPDVNWNVPFV
jgi:hypothetical protein